MPTKKNNKKILIAEDDTSLLKALKDKFKSLKSAEKELQVVPYSDTETSGAKVEIITPEFNHLEIYKAAPIPGEEPKIGDLKTYGEKKQEPVKERVEIPKAAEEKPEHTVEEGKFENPEKGLFKQGVPQDVEKKIDKRVKEIITGEEESEDESSES